MEIGSISHPANVINYLRRKSWEQDLARETIDVQNPGDVDDAEMQPVTQIRLSVHRSQPLSLTHHRPSPLYAEDRESHQNRQAYGSDKYGITTESLRRGRNISLTNMLVANITMGKILCGSELSQRLLPSGQFRRCEPPSGPATVPKAVITMQQSGVKPDNQSDWGRDQLFAKIGTEVCNGRQWTL